MAIWIWWAAGLTLTTLAASFVMRKSRDMGYPVLMALFAGYVLSANILAPRLVVSPIGLAGQILSTGSLIWPFTAQLIDMANEVYGRRKAYTILAVAYLVNCVFLTTVWLGSAVVPIWEEAREAFWLAYFHPAPRILLASLVTSVICVGIDITVFASLKRRHMRIEADAGLRKILVLAGLRAVTSDMVNMVLDGVLFAVLAFSFVLPIKDLVGVILGSIVVKALLALVDKPWFVLFRVLVRRVRRDY